MTLRSYLAVIVVGTAVAWSAVALVVTNADPTTAPAMVFVSLYLALTTALAGSFSLAGLVIRSVTTKKPASTVKNVGASFRQGALLAILCSAVLILKTDSLLHWWTGALLIAALTGIELLLISMRWNA